MNLKLLGALGAVAAAALLFVFVVSPLMFADDDEFEPVESASQPSASAERGAEAEAEAEADVEEPAADPVDETFEVFTARDPFQQLAQASDGATTASAVVGETADGGASDSQDVAAVDGDGDGSGGTGGTGAGSGDAPSSDASVDGTAVRLVEVFEGADGTATVQVTVNDTGYDAREGDDFAGRFRVLSIDDRCATFLYGDQRFTLCEGESIRK